MPPLLPPRSRLGPDLITEPGRLLVVLPGDGLIELFAQGLFDRELLADLLLDDAELLDQREVGRIGRVVLFPPGALMGVKRSIPSRRASMASSGRCRSSASAIAASVRWNRTMPRNCSCDAM